MPASNSFQSDLLNLLFCNTNIANLGDATGVRGSSTAGNLYVAIHTADPTAAGNQTSNECNYTGYARVAIARSGSTFTVSGSSPTQVVNAALVAFATCTAGSNTAAYFSIGFASSGASEILASGPLGTPLAISTGVAPVYNPGTLIATFN